MAAEPKGRGGNWLYALLLIPMLVLWVPLYNSVEPTFLGFPFFYWFQLGFILVGMVVVAVVYYATEPK